MTREGNISNHTKTVKELLSTHGFEHIAISKADFLESEAKHLENWLSNNMHGKMQYMENHFDKRLDPRLLHEGTKSVISIMYNYFPAKSALGKYKVSKYAYGEDYHLVIKDRLNSALVDISDKIGSFQYRVFVDSAPVLEKAWAQRGGLGWIGKNSNLIAKSHGSFFFLAEILCDLELEYNLTEVRDYCGTCNKCIEACPTDAIVAPNVVNGSQCISYLNIELKENIPNEFKNKLDDWIFGCDICQDVCPWNRFSKPTKENRFHLNETLEGMIQKDFENLTEETFNKAFKNSPLKRKKFKGINSTYNFLQQLE